MSLALTIVMVWGGASVAGTFLMGAFLRRNGWEHQPRPDAVRALRPHADAEPPRLGRTG